MTDGDRIDFLLCYIRNNCNFPALCAEMNLKDTTARMRLKSIQDASAKRNAETGEAGGSGSDVSKTKGGKKTTAAKGTKAEASGAGGKKKATPKSKKRKMEEEDDEEEEKVENLNGADEF